MKTEIFISIVITAVICAGIFSYMVRSSITEKYVIKYCRERMVFYDNRATIEKMQKDILKLSNHTHFSLGEKPIFLQDWQDR